MFKRFKAMSLTGVLKDYAEVLEIDLIGFCSVDRFDEAPPDTKPFIYLKNVKSVISISRKLNYTAILGVSASTVRDWKAELKAGVYD